MSNNLAKSSILATVALVGYDLKLVLDPNDPLNTALKSQQTTPKSTPGQQGTAQKSSALHQASSSPKSASSYTTNATNVIQNSLHLVPNDTSKTTSSFKAYVPLPETNLDADVGEVAVEKENTASSKKYAISGTCTNGVVKMILDKLLTQFIANKLATDSEKDVILFK